MKDALVVVGLVILLLAAIVGFSALWAWILCLVWNGVFVPTWDLMPLSFLQVWAITVFLSMVVSLIRR